MSVSIFHVNIIFIQMSFVALLFVVLPSAYLLLQSWQKIEHDELIVQNKSTMAIMTIKVKWLHIIILIKLRVDGTFVDNALLCVRCFGQ